ncbi:MAG: hypothetical protein AB9866_13885 [Syntrophobacteraceae bacterium]
MQNATAIQTFMSQYEISMQLRKMHQSGRTAVPDEPVNRYKCELKRPGKQVDVYVAVPSEEGEITPSDVLFMLILDASGCEMFKDYYARQEEFNQIFADAPGGASDFEDFWQEYESRCRQSTKLRTFLGKNLYEELIIQFGFQN